MNTDFPYQSIDINKEKSCDFVYCRFPIEIDNDSFIDCYRLLSIIIGKYLSHLVEVQELRRCCLYGIFELFHLYYMQFFSMIKD